MNRPLGIASASPETKTTDEPVDQERDAMHLLVNAGFTHRGGGLRSLFPDKPITQEQWDAIHYLCDEWDYDFEAAKEPAS